MLNPMCSQPPCKNIDVSSVSGGNAGDGGASTTPCVTSYGMSANALMNASGSGAFSS